MSDDGHEQSRKKVCIICSRKATRKFPLSETDVKSIKELVDDSFKRDDPDYPCGLCNGCNKECNGHNVELPINQVYKSGGGGGASRFLRSVGSSCSCSICEIGYSDANAIVSSKKKRGRPRTTNLTTPEQPEPLKYVRFALLSCIRDVVTITQRTGITRKR